MTAEILITSKANPRLKDLRHLCAASGARRTHTLLLGEKLIHAWADTPTRLTPECWLRLDGVEPHPLARRFRLDTWVLSEKIMNDLTDAGSPPRHALLMSLGPQPSGPLPSRVIVPWGVQDPGNVGAILRSAAAFGFQEAMLGPGCADPFSPKALRGTMGAAFLLPIRLVEHIPSDEGRWYALDGAPGALPLAEADLAEPVRLMVGNEGHGWAHVDLPDHVQRLAIPTEGVESLNAAVAAGIACYEVARRRA